MDHENTWITALEMHSIMANDNDIDPDEVSVDDIEELLDEMVEMGIWEENDDGEYRVRVGPGRDFVNRNAPVDRTN